MQIYRDKVVLVTGGTGSIGSELVRQLIAGGAKQVRVYARDESKHYQLREDLGYPESLRLLVGDVRDKERLGFALEGVDYVFHAAAMKHVSLCEHNPFEAIKTNVMGSQNLIDMATYHGVKKVIAVSTDKAVNPTTLMGTSKLLMEKMFTSANFYGKQPKTIFSCVRFGNVAWARGSVLGLWRKQAETKRTIRVTDMEMTRFFMSINEAVRLTLRAADLAKGGEVFVFKMPSIKLSDLSSIFIKKYFGSHNISIEIIGRRSGDALHEKLFIKDDKHSVILSNGEVFIIIPDGEMYRINIQTGNYEGFSHVEDLEHYSSLEALSPKDVEKII